MYTDISSGLARLRACVAKSSPEFTLLTGVSGAPFLVEKETKREGHIELCNNPECDYRAPAKLDDEITCRAELRKAATRLKESRELEFLALVAPEARQALAESQVQLSSYRGL